jgi:MarR family transcriptional regulator, organic hydroperoxide resistance regulator
MTAKRNPAESRKRSPPLALPRLPFEASVGYQIRMTHRAVARLLQVKIAPFGASVGMWYFLRALWEEDGLTQRELSRRIGTTEPTTLTAIAAMERAGFVTRRRDRTDGRKLNVLLTPKGRDLKLRMLPFAIEVVETATAGFSKSDTILFLRQLRHVQSNIAAALAEDTTDDAPD